MPVEPWLLPVLWRERDWRAALARLAVEMTKVARSPSAQRSALELGRACEYIEPDRRRAIAAYELGAGHDLGRACELAIELGWWAGRARLCATARGNDPDPRLALDEAEAWWDAGQPELTTLALAGLRGERPPREADLQALVSGKDRVQHAERIAARAAEASDADDYVMAARFAHPIRNLEAALATCPGHAIAARMLLDHAIAGRDADAVQRVVRARLAGLDATASIDAMRATALALIGTDPHRGFGLRLLRQALDTAYEGHHTPIPGHLAMWAALVQRAIADGTRRELLPLAIHAIESSPHPIDHVWLGTLATEISLDAGNPVVAGAYVEIVAEHAPEHPIVLQLVTDVAAATSAVPVAAISAANTAKLAIEIDLDLDDTYAEAVGTPARKKPPPPPKKKAQPSEAAPKPTPKPVPTRSAIVPAVLAKPAAKPAPKPASRPVPVAPMLAALRLPDRPLIPPRIEPENPRERARRISIPIDIRIELTPGTVVEAHSRDLSTSGLFVLTDATFVVGSEVPIVIMLPGDEAFSEQEHRARARVVRRAPGGYGIELIAPDGKLIAALAAL